MRTPRYFSRALAGFSLLELLIVCGIIAVVVGMTIPAATTMIRGSQLTQGAQMLTDQMALARQTALSKNRSIEVSFYKFGDPETPGEDRNNPETGCFRAFQCFEVLESGAAIPVNKVQRLPSTVVINETKELSTIIGDSRQNPIAPDNTAPELPRDVARKYLYSSFRFEADGSTNLSITRPTGDTNAKSMRWFITLHAMDLGGRITEPKDGTGKQINFFTLQIDPISGTATTYRPTAG
jgi:uncharacterized protein (TIGR02596 family)